MECTGIMHIPASSTPMAYVEPFSSDPIQQILQAHHSAWYQAHLQRLRPWKKHISHQKSLRSLTGCTSRQRLTLHCGTKRVRKIFVYRLSVSFHILSFENPISSEIIVINGMGREICPPQDSFKPFLSAVVPAVTPRGCALPNSPVFNPYPDCT